MPHAGYHKFTIGLPLGYCLPSHIVTPFSPPTQTRPSVSRARVSALCTPGKASAGTKLSGSKDSHFGSPAPAAGQRHRSIGQCHLPYRPSTAPVAQQAAAALTRAMRVKVNRAACILFILSIVSLPWLRLVLPRFFGLVLSRPFSASERDRGRPPRKPFPRRRPAPASNSTTWACFLALLGAISHRTMESSSSTVSVVPSGDQVTPHTRHQYRWCVGVPLLPRPTG